MCNCKRKNGTVAVNCPECSNTPIEEEALKMWGEYIMERTNDIKKLIELIDSKLKKL